jgi:hypothetical protein
VILEKIILQLRNKAGDRYPVPRFLIKSADKKVIVTEEKIQFYHFLNNEWVLDEEFSFEELPSLLSLSNKMTQKGISFEQFNFDPQFETYLLVPVYLDTVCDLSEYIIQSYYLLPDSYLRDIIESNLPYFNKSIDELSPVEVFLLSKKSLSDLYFAFASDLNKSPAIKAGDFSVDRESQIRWYLDMAERLAKEFEDQSRLSGIGIYGGGEIKVSQLSKLTIDYDIYPYGSLPLPPPVSLKLDSVEKRGDSWIIRISWTKFSGPLVVFKAYGVCISKSPGVNEKYNGDYVAFIDDIEITHAEMEVGEPGAYYIVVYTWDNHSDWYNDHKGKSNEIQVLVQ